MFVQCVCVCMHTGVCGKRACLRTGDHESWCVFRGVCLQVHGYVCLRGPVCVPVCRDPEYLCVVCVFVRARAYAQVTVAVWTWTTQRSESDQPEDVKEIFTTVNDGWMS